METFSCISADLVLGAASPFLLPLCLFPPLQERVRSFCNPLVTRRVSETVGFVHRVQAFHQPGLLALCSVCNASVSTEFYVLILSILTWTGGIQAAALVGYLLCIALYFGNAIKDMVGAPRPFTIPKSANSNHVVKLQGNGECNNAAEHGLPSTHVINSLVLGLYAVHLWANDGYMSSKVGVYFCCVLWTLWIGWGRMYCGMHSLVDVTSGLCIGSTIFYCYLQCEEIILAVIQSGYNGIVKQFLVLLLLLAVYPRPKGYTPSYEMAITIMGGMFGLLVGYECLCDICPGVVSAGGFAGFRWGAEETKDSSVLALRVPLGLVIMGAVKFSTKPLIHKIVSCVVCAFPNWVRRLWEPSICIPNCGTRSTSGSELKKPVCFKDLDVAHITRFLSYGVLGMCCSFLCAVMFDVLNI